MEKNTDKIPAILVALHAIAVGGGGGVLMTTLVIRHRPLTRVPTMVGQGGAICLGFRRSVYLAKTTVYAASRLQLALLLETDLPCGHTGYDSSSQMLQIHQAQLETRQNTR